MKVKLCYGCKHFNFDVGSPGYSEYTPGEDWSMTCHKGHWYMGGHRENEDKLGPNLERAITCKDYEPRSDK